MEALTTHLSGLAVAVVLRVARYASAFSSFASALAVLRFFSAGGAAEIFTSCPFCPSGVWSSDGRNVLGRRGVNRLLRSASAVAQWVGL